MITLTTAVVRAGKAEEWPGDVVTLCAGDMIPADMRIIVSHATLTGESLHVEFDARETREKVPPLEFANICFLGTSVESGAAKRSCSQQARRLTLGASPASIVRSSQIDRSLIVDGCTIEKSTIEHSIIGIRSVIDADSILKDTILMGADEYETDMVKERRTFPASESV